MGGYRRLRLDQHDTSVYGVRLRVANRGHFPTHVTNKGKFLRRFRPLKVSFAPTDGVEMLSAAGHQELGHLSGVTGSPIVEWFVAAPESPSADAQALGELQVSGGMGGDLRRTIEMP